MASLEQAHRIVISRLSTPAQVRDRFETLQSTGQRFVVEGKGARARRIIAGLRHLEPRSRLYQDEARSVWALSVPGVERPPSHPLDRFIWEATRNIRHVFDGRSLRIDTEGQRVSDWVKPSKKSRFWDGVFGTTSDPEH